MSSRPRRETHANRSLAPRWEPQSGDTVNREAALTSRRWLHLRCANTPPAFPPERRPLAYFSGCPGTLLHINHPFLTFTCHSQFITHLRAHTHTNRKQQRLLMSRNAHRSVKQHDSCLSGGGKGGEKGAVLLLDGCCPQPTVPPNQTMARLSFPAMGVLIL